MPGMVCLPDDTPFAIRTSGHSVSAAAAALHGCTPLSKRFRDELVERLIAGETLTVVAPPAPSRRDAGREFVRLCETLAGIVADCGVAPGRLGLVADARAMPPQAAWLVRTRALGAGPLYLRLGDLPRSHWLQLWHLRTARLLRPVYAGSVTSRCALLAAEAATTVVPGVEIQAPIGSAWVAVEVDASRFHDRHTLAAALRAAVACGEQHHRLARWPAAASRHDAWLNRRLAIGLVGLGDLLRRRGLGPHRHAAYDYLARCLGRVVRVLHGESRRMAHGSGCVPALEQLEPGRALPGGRLREGWDRRWNRAVERHAVRHRNLLALQPWSLFPRHGPADFRYAALLPLLRHADACVFPEPPSIAHWNLNEFIHFHRAAAAALQQRDAAHQIAEHV